VRKLNLTSLIVCSWNSEKEKCTDEQKKNSNYEELREGLLGGSVFMIAG
jgi:hypothetical protein